MRYWKISFAAIVLAVGGNMARGQDYHILLSRPDKEGDSFSISASGSSKQTNALSLGGADAQKTEQSVDVQLDGVVHVLEVKNGKTTKLTCTVQKCMVNEQVALKPGVVVTVENVDGKTVMSADGKPVDEELAGELGIVLYADDPNEKNGYDQMFGTSDTKKVGDQWAINPQSVAEGLSDNGLKVGKDDVTGTVKLEDVKKVGGKEIETVSAEATVNVPAGKLPVGLSFDKASIALHYSSASPTDTGGKCVSESMSLHMVIHVNSTTPDNKTTVGDLTMDRTAKFEFGEGK